MTRNRTPIDPRIASAKEKIEKALADFERYYGRMRRAMLKMEDCRKTIRRNQATIKKAERELAQPFSPERRAAILAGYSGDNCPLCGKWTLVRNNGEEVCESCNHDTRE